MNVIGCLTSLGIYLSFTRESSKKKKFKKNAKRKRSNNSAGRRDGRSGTNSVNINNKMSFIKSVEFYSTVIDPHVNDETCKI